jgi:type VI secretion system protein ImpH
MAVIERLLAEPQRFEFFQAVRLLLLWLEERGVPSQHALERHLRFANSLSLRFPASQIEALALVHDKDAANLGIPRPQFRITPAFMGLLGAHGGLPIHYTERIQAWQAQEGDDAPRAFLDIFTNRMLALFYGAWKKYRVEHAVTARQDSFMPLLLALAGFAPGARESGAGGVDERMLALYAGVLRQRPASSAVLGRVLSDVFRVPVAIEEGVGHWDRLAPAERSTLGGENAVLGQAALLGEACWRPDLRVRVRIGPLDSREFERFLPHGAGAAALQTMLGLFAAPTLSYEIVLVLRRTELRALRLGERSRRLGLDAYLVTAPVTFDRADMRYELRPLPPLPPLG